MKQAVALVTLMGIVACGSSAGPALPLVGVCYKPPISSTPEAARTTCLPGDGFEVIACPSNYTAASFPSSCAEKGSSVATDTSYWCCPAGTL